MVFAFLSDVIIISNLLSSHKNVVSVSDFNLALSIASDALDTNSLKNISLFE
jgi:hypothetical protein